MARLLRRLHRLHRFLGTVLCVLMASWFLSGAVMTFASFPYYMPPARLRDLAPLGAVVEQALPVALQARLQTLLRVEGAELSLTRADADLRWTVHRANGALGAVLAHAAPHVFAPLSEEQARRLAERVVGAPALRAVLLSESDQWSVPQPSSVFPLWQVALGDAARSELYVSAASAEIVQRTTRAQRVLAWIGAIPHWIYPTMLRRQRVLWRNLVIALASVSLLLTGAGLMAGFDTARRLRRSRARGVGRLNDASLRLHQRIGLGFGALVLCWLFSGILSFNPFDWTASRGSVSVPEPSHSRPSAQLSRLFEALSVCERELRVRELRVRYVASTPIALCLDGAGARRSVELTTPVLRARRLLAPELLGAAARALVPPGRRFSLQRVDRADQYYYPTHTESEIVLPYIRVDVVDASRTSHYLDPRSGELLRTFTTRTRLERFLYHGLHSWDFAFLYGQRGLWQALVLTAMALGATLSLLGVGLAVRRILRRRQKVRRLRTRARMANDALNANTDTSGQSLG